MGIIQILTSLFHGKPGKDGMWDFAGKRATVRAQVELERIRNEGTQKLVRSLPPAAVLIEGGPGWFREIRMPETLLPCTPLSTTADPWPPIAPLPAAELEPSSQQRQESTDNPC